jgi:hypothetical protein
MIRRGSGFTTQNVAQVEFREEHKVRSAKAALYNALQIREGFCCPRRPEKFDDVGLPDRRLERGHNSVERFQAREAETLYLDFSDCHLSSVLTLMDKVPLIASSCSRGLCIQKGPDVADEHLVVLKQGAVPRIRIKGQLSVA